MLVKAAPNLQCPKEGNPREYITDSVPVDVPDTAYYRRLLDDGSLVEAAPAEAPAEAKPGKKQTGGDQ